MKQSIFKKLLVGVMSAAMVVSAISVPVKVQAVETNTSNNNDLKLWYNSPAANSYAGWEQYSLPVGNSGIGASVFGRYDVERIQLNEKSLWSGGPSQSRPNYMGGNVVDSGRYGQTVKEIQDLFAAGKTNEASNKCGSLVGVSDDAGVNGYGYYLSYGNMYLNFNHKNVTNYYRELDLRTAIATVQYTSDGVNYKRETFVSYPDNVLVTRITADSKAIDVEVEIQPDNTKGGGSNNPSSSSYTRKWNTTVNDHLISIQGTLDDNQMKFVSHTKVIADGTTTDKTSTVAVTDASEVTIITSIGTDYKNDYPVYRTGETDAEVSARVLNYVTKATAKSYDDLKADHIADHDNIFGRVELNIGQVPSTKTTDALLAAYNNGSASEEERRYIEVLLFQFGRYLTIGSSRETPEDDPSRATLPSNLQGIWVGGNNSAWHADYHMNVNLQMNYWPTYSTNMAECAEPLVAYIDSLREPGRVTANIYAGIESTETNPENGFMAHTQNNPFGWTCPGWSFDWGWSPAAVPWILQNVWEHYEFTLDEEFMAEKIYPMMREESVLYDQMLIEDKDGYLVSSPSYSPEHGPRTEGNTYEQALIWQLYEDTIKAAEILGKDADKVAEWKENQANLKGPIEIGTDGQIKEWYHETTLDSVQPNQYSHRHISHMLGLFPGDLISVETPEWFEAARVSMENRTDESTGWGMGQRINTWARLGDGNKAYKLVTDLFKRGILTNLWDTHAPFQIDGNFGYTSGVAEMLLQSNVGYINMLPALPDTWATGSVDGLVARGNFEIAMDWANGKVTSATILSNKGGEAVVQVADAALASVIDEDGNYVEVEVVSDNRIAFDTEEGKTYTLTDFPESVQTPENVKAEKIQANEAILTWDEVEGATYKVYRKVNGGDVVLIATTDTATYTDTKALDMFDSIEYYVSAVVNTVESALSAGTPVSDLRNMGMIDDRDPRIEYTGGWGDWTENVNYAGTIKFINNPVGGETASLTFYGTGIEVIVCTNYDRGFYEVFIDGVSQGKVDTYSASTVRQKTVFSKTDLDYGKHTIKLVVLNEKQAAAGNTKVELDAFNVINNTTVNVDSVTLTTKPGITTIGKAGNVQLDAKILPENATSKNVTYTSSDTSIATVNKDGVATFTGKNGTVTFTATAGGVNGTLEVKVAIPTNEATTTTVEDNVGGTTQTLNPNITYSSANAWYTWAEGGHSGGTKSETPWSSSAGAYLEYTFNGTGIDVLAHKNGGLGNYKVYIDGNEVGEASLIGSDEKNSVIFSKKDLANGEHTIKLENTTDKQVNFDAFVVYSPAASDIADKAELQDVIVATSQLDKDAFDAGKWAALETAYYNAVTAMNSATATQAEIKTATDALKAARTNLGDAVAPVVTDEKGEVVLVETTKVMVQWDKVPGATSYIVKVGDKETDTSNLYATVTGLNPSTEYEVKVYAVNSAGRSSKAIEIGKVTTAVDLNKVVNPVTDVKVTQIDNTSAKVQWTAPKDTKVSQYVVIINGEQKVVKTNEITLTGLVVDKANMVKVVAVDENGIKSSPVQKVFTLEKVTEKPFPFEDVFKGQWYYEYVDQAYQLGLMTGATETLFKPTVSMNRGMVAIVLHRMEGEEEVSFAPIFPDVYDKQYFTTAVMWAKQTGIITGYNNGTFMPLKEVTREEMATMIQRFAKYKGLDVASSKDITYFQDYADISTYAKAPIQWCVENGVLSGKFEGTKVDPLGTATRAECAKMLVQAYKVIYK